jgi:hypothetical protein
MRRPINVKSPNNITNWQMRFNSAFKGLISLRLGIQELFHKARMHSLRQGVATNSLRVRNVVAEEVVVWSALMNDRSAAREIGTC